MHLLVIEEESARDCAAEIDLLKADLVEDAVTLHEPLLVEATDTAEAIRLEIDAIDPDSVCVLGNVQVPVLYENPDNHRVRLWSSLAPYAVKSNAWVYNPEPHADFPHDGGWYANSFMPDGKRRPIGAVRFDELT